MGVIGLFHMRGMRLFHMGGGGGMGLFICVVWVCSYGWHGFVPHVCYVFVAKGWCGFAPHGWYEFVPLLR